MPRPSTAAPLLVRFTPLLLPFLLGVLPACSRREESTVPVARAEPPVSIKYSRLNRGMQPARLIGKLWPPEKLEPWISEATHTRIGPLPGEEAADAPMGVLLGGKAPKVLRIPGNFRPEGFNRVAVELASQASVIGELEFRSGDQALGSHTARLEEGDAGVRELRFESGGRPLLRKAGDQLRLELDSAGPCFVAAVSFWKAPLDEYLPSPAAGPLPVTIGRDTRPALGFSTTAGLQLDLQVPEHATLEASYGLFQGSRSGRDRPEIRVRVESGAGTRTFHTFKFSQGATLDGWNPMTIPLEEHVGRRTRVRFEIGSVQGRPQYAALSEPKIVRPQHVPPTLILISTDSHRADHFAGGDRERGVDTPNLDALAARGTWFTDCFAATNLSRPSQVALLTGRSPRDTRVHDDVKPLPSEVLPLAEVFRRNGWTTLAAVGTATLAPPDSGLGRGFDRMLAPEEGHSPANSAISWLRAQLRQLDDRPVFVWLHLSDLQLPYPKGSPLAVRYLGEEFDLEDPRLPAPEDPIAPLVQASDREARTYLEGLYKAQITGLDDQLPTLLRRERFRRGWVVYTSGHGESLGEHGYWWTHAGLYPQTLHVPLILSGPGVPVGKRITTPVSQLDVGRTVLDLVGLSHESFPGRSLLTPPGPEEGAPGPRFAVGAHREHVSVTTDRWHLQLTFMPRQEPNREEVGTAHAVELYDLLEDPSCEVNRVDIERERATELRALLLEWLGGGWIDPECRCDWCVGFR